MNTTDYMDSDLNGASQSTIEIISPAERIKRFGIECIGPVGDGITFKAGCWKPGGEYIQKLIIRNVSTTVKKLKYKLPITRYFSMAYPEVIILSPGMFQEIDVVFRPVENEPYDDSVYIKMQEGPGSGGFHVPVRATIEKLLVTSPIGVELGFCAAFQTTSAMFQLRNVGEVDAPFRWETVAPFVIEPSSGLIPIGQSQDICVSIFPLDASVYVAQATCHVGENVHALIPQPVLTTKFTAICKHTFIVLSEGEVSFGEVLSGTSADVNIREVELRNNGVVPAEFELIRHEGDRDEVFEVTPKRGVIPAMSELPVKIKYYALAMGVYSCDHYTFKTPGGSCTTLVCKGTSMPPRVTLSKEMTGAALALNSFPDGSPSNSINFRDVEVGHVETRIIFLKNDDNRETTFSVVADEKSTFQIEPRQGRLPALAQYFPVKLVFAPTKPVNYYRRLFVLIGDALPLFFDCLGSGHIRAKGEIKEQRPAPIRHAHIQAYRNREIDGYAALSPEQLDELRKQGLGKDSYFAQVGLSGTLAMSVSAFRYPLTRTGESARNVVAPAHEFFISETDSSRRVVTVSREHFDFGFTAHHATSMPQTVTITNNTNGKVCVIWNIPRIHGDNHDKKHKLLDVAGGGSVSSSLELASPAVEDLFAPVFAVEPTTADINSGKSQTFQLTFRPLQSNRNYVSELEAFVFFKNQRTFRLVDDASLTPPWCLPIAATGHTFSSGQLLAKGKLVGGSIRGGKLVFPSCFVNESIYETVVVHNTSNMPCTFSIHLGWDADNKLSFVDDEVHRDNETFTVKPNSGEIDAGGFVLICVRFSPKEARRKYEQLARCVINGAPSGKLILEGSGEIPFLWCPDLQEKTIADRFLGPSAWTMKEPIPQGFQGTYYMQPTCIGLSTSHAFVLKNASRLPLRFQVNLPHEAAGILSITPVKGLIRGNEDVHLRVAFAPQAPIRYDFKIVIKSFPVGGVAPEILDARQVGITRPPEVLQTLRVTFVAPGAVGAMTFEPAALTVDVRLVNTFETKTIWIENVSDADLSYALCYQTDFTQDTGTFVQFVKSSPVRPLFRKREEAEAHQRRTEANTAVSPMESDFGDSLFCEHPSGILAARSRKAVTFTFFPINAGLFEFSVYARLTALDRATGNPVEITNEEAALLRLSQMDRDTAAESPSSACSPSQKEYSEKMRTLPLMTHITGRAAFPTMVFEDIRTPDDGLVSDVEMLWSRFSLTELNHDLSIPPTEDELKLYGASSPDLLKLKRYNFEFTPAPIGAPLQTVFLQVRNNGFLSTSFRAHLPNEKELDLEIWCDEDEPSEELNQIICIIEEMKVFTFEPKEAVLAPGESCIITMTYSHTYLKYGGLHKIPLLVKVDQGKMFYVDLIGKTIPHPHNPTDMVRALDPYNSSQSIASGTHSAPPGEIQPPHHVLPSGGPGMTGHHTGSLQLGHSGSALSATQSLSSALALIPDLVVIAPVATSNGCVEMISVPIGLPAREAPRQRIELVNTSEVDSFYTIEMDSIEEINRMNFDQPLIRIANPNGVLLSRSSIFVEVYFYPLEAKEYEFPLTITYCSLSQAGSAGFGFAQDNIGFGAGIHALPHQPSFNALPRASSPKSALPSSPQSASRAGTKKPKSTGKPGQGRAAHVPQPPQVLQLTAKVSGYDPRIERPAHPGSLYHGGLPPAVPPMTVPGSFTTLSADCVDFGLIPQCCVAHRLVILRNTLQSTSLEFFIDVSSSYLIEEGLLIVKPVFGKLEPGGHVTFDFMFKASAPPALFSDRLKVVVRERIKDTGGRRSGGANSRLLEKIKTKKPPSAHDSIVTRSTTAISEQFSYKEVPDGRVAAMPSTMTASGLVEPAKIGKQAKLAETGEMAEIGVVEDRSGTRGGRPDERTRNLSRSTLGSGVLGSRSNADVLDRTSSAGGSRSNSPSASRAFSQSVALTATSPSSRAGDGMVLLGPPKVHTIRIHGEVFTLDTVDNLLDNGPLRGVMKGFMVPADVPFIAPSVAIVPPPRGVVDSSSPEVVPLENFDQPPSRSRSPLLDQAPSPPRSSSSSKGNNGNTNTNANNTGSSGRVGAVNPASQRNATPTGASSRVSPNPSLKSTQQLSGHTRSISPNHNPPSLKPPRDSPSPPPGTKKLGSGMATFSAAIPTRHATQLTTPTATRALGAPAGGGFARSNSNSTTSSVTAPPRKSVLAAPVVPFEEVIRPRQHEVRGVAEVVMFNLFRTILTSVPLREYTAAVQAEAVAASPLVGGLKWSPIAQDPSSAISVASSAVGASSSASTKQNPTATITGKPIYGVYFQEIVPSYPLHELLVRELKHMGYQSSDADISSATVGAGTSNLQSPVPGIPAPWVLGDGKNMLADAAHFQLSRGRVMDAVRDLGLPAKGHTAKGIAAALADYTNDGGFDLDDLSAPINLSKLIKMLPQGIADRLSVKVNEVYSARLSRARRARRSQAASSNVLSLDNPSVEDDNSSERELDAFDEFSGSLSGGSSLEPASPLMKAATHMPFMSSSAKLSPVTSSPPSSLPTGPRPLVSQTQMSSSVTASSSNASAASSVAGSVSSGSKAAVAIQKVARGNETRVVVTKKVQELVDQQVQFALCQSAFLELASDVLHNTMFNLIEEATYGEFPVTAEPIKFAFKRATQA